MTEFLQMVIRIVDELYLRRTSSGEIPERDADDKRGRAIHAALMLQRSCESSGRDVVFVVSSSADVKRVYSSRQKAEEFLHHTRSLHFILEFEIDGLA